jgi:acyl dehydratase
MKYFEDITVGDRRELGSFTFTADLIKAFASKYDPQPFHLDEEAGRKSIFGGLAASGWHVCAVYMKLAVGNMQREIAELVARGGKQVVSSPGAGFRDLKWIKPVLAGDTLTYSSEVMATRPLESRPGWGLVNYYNTAINQRGELVVSFIVSAFTPRQPTESPAN